MNLDPHIHSCYSGDARSRPREIIKQSLHIGLDIIAISDHNTIKGSQRTIDEAKDKDILVIPSIEISSSEGHIIGFGVEENISRGLSPENTLEKIHNAGGIAIIPHPFSFYRHGLFCNVKPYDLDIEAIEVRNARYIAGYSNFKSKNLAIKKQVAQIGSSDSHFIKSIGNCYTKLTDIDSEPSVDDVIEAIKSQNTIAKGKRTSNYLIAKEVFNKKIKRIY